MFNELDIVSILNDREVIEKWDEYKSLRPEDYSIPPLSDFVTDISGNDLGGYPLKDSVLSVIDAWIFSASHSMEEMIRIANESTQSRMEELKVELSPEAYAMVERGQRLMEEALPPIDLKPSLPQELSLRSAVDTLPNLDRGDLESLAKQLLINEQSLTSVIKALVTKNAGTSYT